VLIGYKARGREEGNKLTWRDGVEPLWIATRCACARVIGRVADVRSTPTRPQIMPPGRR
jgi:hypothetical protein